MPLSYAAAFTAAALLFGTVVSTFPLESCIRPGEERRAQFISFAVPVSYCFRDLQPSTTYEVRLSWPASQPTNFTFELIYGEAPRSYLPGRVSEPQTDADEVGAPGASDVGSIKVTGSERITFQTDGDGRALLPSLQRPERQVSIAANRLNIYVSAIDPSISRPGSVVRTGTAFNIRLEPLITGLLPQRSLGLVPLLLVSAALALWLPKVIVSFSSTTREKE